MKGYLTKIASRKRNFSRNQHCMPSRNSQSVHTSITDISQEIVRNGLLGKLVMSEIKCSLSNDLMDIAADTKINGSCVPFHNWTASAACIVVLHSTLNVIQRRSSSDLSTVCPNLLFTSQTRPRTKNRLFSVINIVLPRRSNRVDFGIPPMRLIAEWATDNLEGCRVSNGQSGRKDCHVSHSM